MNDDAIRVEGLVKSFGDVKAVDGVTFSVAPGTIYGLLGPNGAGKTTTIRMLATVIPPDGGKATVLGHDVAKDGDAVRRSIGLAGQFAAVDPNLTGRENLRMVAKLSQLAPRGIAGRANDLLERFDLVEAGDRPVRTYSGGMRRRLDVAASLVASPPILFLDEPTTGLDIQTRSELWDMLNELVEQGTTVLLTTQYLEEADRLASRLAVIDKGHVIAEDTPAALKANLGATVIEMEFTDPQLADKASAILTELTGSSSESQGTQVRLTTGDGTHPLVEGLRRLDAAGIEPKGLNVREPSLDDVFLRLTGRHVEAENEPLSEGAAR